MKETSSKAIATPNANFTKDGAAATAYIPELGELVVPIAAYHEAARFNEKSALVEQATWMFGDPDTLGADFWTRHRKEVLAVAVASRVSMARSTN